MPTAGNKVLASADFEFRVVVPKKPPKKPPGKVRKFFYDLAKSVFSKLIWEGIKLIWEFLKNLLCLKSRTAHAPNQEPHHL